MTAVPGTVAGAFRSPTVGAVRHQFLRFTDEYSEAQRC